MSLERSALRIATTMALTNAFVGPDYPTIAGNRVFDSRIDSMEGLNHADLVPTLIVYTDDTQGEALSNNNGGPPFRDTVSLIIQASVGMAVHPDADEDGNIPSDADPDAVEVIPLTCDPDLEVMLDLLESQVRQALDMETQQPWTQRLFADHINRIVSSTSARFVERDGSARLTARQITFDVEIAQPDVADVVVVASGESVPDASPTIPAPLGPLIDDILATPECEAAETIQGLKNLLTQYGGFAPTTLPALESVRMIEGDDGGGLRPDGVADVQLPQT